MGKRIGLFLAFTGLALFLGACGFLGTRPEGPAVAAAADPKQARALSRDTCPVTQPDPEPFVPPEPFPPRPPVSDQFWYGSDALWTALPVEGSWEQLGYGEKVFWWNAAYIFNKEPAPDLVVSARRLDDPAIQFETQEATNASHPSFQSAMLVGVHLPTSGCWEFTGTYQGYELKFIVWVPA